jgi:hypothetical protein
VFALDQNSRRTVIPEPIDGSPVAVARVLPPLVLGRSSRRTLEQTVVAAAVHSPFAEAESTGSGEFAV